MGFYLDISFKVYGGGASLGCKPYSLRGGGGGGGRGFTWILASMCGEVMISLYY